MRLPGVSRGFRAGRNPLVSVLRHQRRDYRAAVIGGGITGLTSALQLSTDPQCDSITIYEKSPRLGGWLESETIPVEGGHVVFEYGPRTLRSVFPGSLPLLCLISDVGLFDQLIVTPKRSPAALNRFIYYPDHIVRLPSPTPNLSPLDNLRNIFHTISTEPLFKGLLSGLLLEHTKPARTFDQWREDESVASFISRRFNSDMADNLVSAVMHGIYAGDIDKLSAQMLMGHLRNLEDGGVIWSLISQAFNRAKTRSIDEFLAWAVMSKRDRSMDSIMDMKNVMDTGSTFTLKGGTQQLVEGLEAALRNSGKVDILTNTGVSSISQTRGEKDIYIQAQGGKGESYERAIATLPAPALAKALKPTNHPNQKVPHESIARLQEHDYATTVMVVNLYYSNPNLLPMDGFGYLIPRSIPVDQNPECGLGVIFASSSSVGKSALPPYADVSQDTVPGTKLTVMFGGHYWDGWKETDYPDHDTAVRMARTMLERHLGITDAPAVARARLQREAIPQYTVGHLHRMYALSHAVRSDFSHRLGLAGNWYNGVGVGDCVKQGVLAATLGTGRVTLENQYPIAWAPWVAFNYREWEFEGGITMSPVRYVDMKEHRIWKGM